jgi:hypothetical protein
VKRCFMDACLFVNLRTVEDIRCMFLHTLLKSLVLCWELQAPLLINFVFRVLMCLCVSPVPIFMCTPCGIRFSSLSTLEAHQTYYCSHRTGSTIVAGSAKAATHKGEDCGKVPLRRTQYSCAPVSTDPVSAVYRGLKKNWKIKDINGS